MTDKKLTDAEIVKALEICSNNGDCKECPINPHHGNYGYCTSLAIKAALDLINRLQAEVERLKSDVSVSKDAYMSMKDRYEYEKEKVEKAKQKCIDIGKALKNAKAEAVKEFAERLKERAIQTSFDPIYGSIMTVDVDDVDNLLKEMVGDNNA